MTSQRTAVDTASAQINPWNALWAMMIGFFMILVDSTIVGVANPSIMTELQTDYDAVIWVTSAYLLAYAVPLLVAGRLGDQFGPKNLYLIGLFVFTVASLWCGLSGSVQTLIAARVLQGVGAALLTPQTLSAITKIFPAAHRGVAMSVWGATAGVATLVGPLAGGVLVDHLGWQWIFFVNVPIGIVGLVLAAWLVPALPTTPHRFDVLGVVLSGAAMFLVVFGLQEGESQGWSGWIWTMIVAGLGLMAAFVYWQAVNRNEPLIPLRIFADRDFTLSNVGVAVIGFAVTAMIVPVMFYAQVVCDLSPTRSALLMAPMAICSGLLAPLVGRIVDRAHPMPVIGFGFSSLAVALTWLSVEMTPTTPIWRLVLPFVVMGVGMAFVWAPLAATATRNLPPELAGAGSGVYNTTRQVGSVLGSAGIAAFMTARIGAEMPGGQAGGPPDGGAQGLPQFLREPFSSALSQSMLLPAFVALFGVVAALFLAGTVKSVRAATPRPEPSSDDQRTEVLPAVVDESRADIVAEYADRSFDDFDDESEKFWRAQRPLPVDSSDLSEFGEDFEDYEDDDDYIEFTIDHAPPPMAETVRYEVADRYAESETNQDDQDYDDFDDAEEYQEYADYGDIPGDDTDTSPLSIRVEHPRPAPADAWRSAPVESWHSLLDDHDPADDAESEPIGHAHNGFHVESEDRMQPLPPPPRREQQDYFTANFQQLSERIDNLAEGFPNPPEDRRGEFSFDMPEYLPPPPVGGNGAGDGSRHRSADDLSIESPNSNGDTGGRGRHYREDPDDSSGRGRHSRPFRD